MHENHAEGFTDTLRSGEDFAYQRWLGIGGDIEIFGCSAKQSVPHTSAGEIRDLASRLELADDLNRRQILAFSLRILLEQAVWRGSIRRVFLRVLGLFRGFGHVESVTRFAKGSKMSAMQREMELVFDDQGRLAEDVTCLNCGYDLRGLQLESVCPECGVPVRVSLRRDLLGEADAAYRQRLCKGAVVLHIGAWLVLPLLYVGVLVAAAGLWMLTDAQPERSEPRLDRRLRQLARWFVWGGLGALVGIFVATLWIGVWRVWRTLGGWQPMDMMLVTLHGLMFMGMLAAFEVFRMLARRIPDESLVRRCVRMRVAAVVALALCCAVALGTSLATNWWYYGRTTSSGVAMELAVFVAPIVLWGTVLLWFWLELVLFTRQLLCSLRQVAE